MNTIKEKKYDIISPIEGVKLLLIAEKNGISYFMHVFDPEMENIEETILAGLVNALVMFSEATIQDEIQSAQFAKVDIKFQIHNNLLFILIISHKMNQNLVSDIIRSIRIKFLEKYGHILNDKTLDYSIFDDFSKDVEEILQLDRYILENFRGHQIYKTEMEFILTLERVGEKKLRIVPSLKPQENGFVIQMNHITEINSFMRNLLFIPETIDKLRYLEKLCLDRNKIRRLPQTICSLNKLKFLSMQNNHLSELPLNFSNLSSLEYVDFSWNRIEQLPEDIDKFKNLKILNLSWNKISYIPNTEGVLPNLKEINLSYNRIQKLPFLFKNIPKIEILNLEGNKINSISERINRGKIIDKDGIDNYFKNLNLKIKEINLKANRIRRIPKFFGYFTNLKYLNLESNQLDELPVGIINLQYLEMINLRGNPLRDLSAEVKNWLKFLKMQNRKVIM